MLPGISCQCLTYGRTAYLEEAIEFFLRQDYAGPKELIVMNDLPDQRLIFDHPDVRIVNAGSRFGTVGEKRNAAVRCSSGDVIVCWDDDDGFLPGHLSACARYIDGYDYARPSRCLVWVENTRIDGVAGSFISQHVFTRDAFERVGGYANMNSGQDMELDNRLRRAVRCHWPSIEVHEITYLFRWANGAYHLSGYGRDRPGATSGYVEVARLVERAIADGLEPSGDVQLVPRFRHDYLRMVERFLAGQSRGAGDGLHPELETRA